MSTHQQTKPRFANQSITEESARPGTERSKVGCDAIDEPCTNSIAGLPSGEPTYFSHRNKLTSPLFAQCSAPVTRPAATSDVSMVPFSSRGGNSTPIPSIDLRAGFADDARPAVLLGAEEHAELGRSRSHGFDARRVHVGFHFIASQHHGDFTVQSVDDRRRRAFRREQPHPH